MVSESMRVAAAAVIALAVTACAGNPGRDLSRAGGAPPVEATTEELAAAAASSRARCEQGFAVDCRKLGRAHLIGAGVPADDRLAAALLMKGCEIGEPASCSDLGVLTLLGRGVAQDDAVGSALTRRACDAGFALACSNLGTLTVEGVSKLTLRPDQEGERGGRIVRYFQTACEAGAPEGCLNLGTARERGDLVDKDAAAASRAYQRACEGGLPLACHRWALLAIAAPDAAPEADVAALNVRACRAGIAPACTHPGETPGPAGPQTPSPRLVAERSSFALGIPGAGGFHLTDLARPPGGPRRPRALLRRLPAGQLATLPAPLRQRLDLEQPAEGEVKPDEPVELLLRLRRAQLATCLERDRSTPAAAQLVAFFLVESNGRPGELRAATEPPDQELETCAMEVIGGWSFPVPSGGVGGPYLLRFSFEAAPPGPAPEYASSGGLRAALKEPGCVERKLRVPDAYRGVANAVTVKLVVDRSGQPVLFHALTPAPEPVVAVIGEAVRVCAFRPGIGEDGQPVALWLTLTVRLDRGR
jgi:TPR repeat protein